uniref:Transporter n=1 Tax=Trichuris muris TaxID=70415 RepID=A0A5S6Q8P2_TRIMR
MSAELSLSRSVSDKSSSRLTRTASERRELLTKSSMFERAVRLEETRGQWSKKLDYLLSMIGYSVGLSNIWRFPYLCYQNGGGAFLIPYVFFLLLCGLPLFFLEAAVGQFTSRSAATMWSICPLFKGVGWATIVITLIVSTYFNVIIAYGLMFLFESLTSGPLPWSSCGHWWNTAECLDYNNVTIYSAHLRYRAWLVNGSEADMEDVFLLFHNRTIKSPSEEFFYNRVLKISSGIEHMDGLVMHLVPCLFVSWLITMACLVKGVKSSGKVVYFTATFPYFLLTVLLVRGLTLDGAYTGIMYYVKPNFTRLLEPRVWSDAAFQVFFSLGPGWGGLITMGSYNRFDNNCLRDSYFLPLIMELTSFYAGFVVFSVIGFMAHVTGKKVDEVVSEGPGLAFITYPEVVSRMPLSQLWSALFFFMVLTVGVDSVFVMVETAITAAHDELLLRDKSQIKRVYILIVGCLAMFLTGFLFITKGGIYLLHLVDQYCAFITVIVICILELLSFAWFYGAERLLSDFEFMIKRKLSPVWAINWRFSTFTVVIAIFFVSVFQYSTDFRMGDSYKYPLWSIGIGWFITCLSFGMIPVYMAYKLLVTPGATFKERWRKCTTPTKSWGPSNPATRLKWEEHQKTEEYQRTLRARCAECVQRMSGRFR